MDDPKPVGPDQETPQTKTPVGEDRTASGFSFDARATQDRLSPRISSFVKGELLAGRFRITRFLARGGMGEVYEAEDTELHERVALKSIRSELLHDARALDRFKREFHLARKVTHPNVCRIFELFRNPAGSSGDSSAGSVVFVAMELLEGQTLGEFLRSQPRVAIEDARPIALQMASGLGAA